MTVWSVGLTCRRWFLKGSVQVLIILWRKMTFSGWGEAEDWVVWVWRKQKGGRQISLSVGWNSLGYIPSLWRSDVWQQWICCSLAIPMCLHLPIRKQLKQIQKKHHKSSVCHPPRKPTLEGAALGNSHHTEMDGTHSNILVGLLTVFKNIFGRINILEWINKYINWFFFKKK